MFSTIFTQSPTAHQPSKITNRETKVYCYFLLHHISFTGTDARARVPPTPPSFPISRFPENKTTGYWKFNYSGKSFLGRAVLIGRHNFRIPNSSGTRHGHVLQDGRRHGRHGNHCCVGDFNSRPIKFCCIFGEREKRVLRSD